jgi:excisionase family DNA binding protein
MQVAPQRERREVHARMRLLRPAEVAERLGVSRSEVYRLVEVYGLPAVRLADRALRIPEEELEAWVSSRRVRGGELLEEGDR